MCPDTDNHKPVTDYLIASPLLGRRYIHSPREGVFHVTSVCEPCSSLSGLVDKRYPDPDGVVVVEQPGIILSDKTGSLHLLESGELAFFDGSNHCLLHESGVELLKTTINDKTYPSVKVQWDAGTVDGIYGLGQYQDGLMDMRGTKRDGHQKNLENCVPLWVSSQGFGVLWDHPAPITLEAEKAGTGIALQSVTADVCRLLFPVGTNTGSRDFPLP
jgi:hypothetical protein